MNPPQVVGLILTLLYLVSILAVALWAHFAHYPATVSRGIAGLWHYPVWLAAAYFFLGLLIGGLTVHWFEKPE